MRISIAIELADDVAEPLDIGFGGLEPQFRLVAARVQARDAGGVFEDAAALFRLGVDEFADLALPHERRRARAGRRIFEQNLDVAGPHLAAVDAVGGARLALDAARHLENFAVVEFGGRPALAVVEEHRDFGAAAFGPRRRAGEDHVVHGRRAHRLVRGLAHHPAERFEQVRLAAAVRTDDARQPRLDDEFGRIDEGFEAQKSEPRDFHVVSKSSMPALGGSGPLRAWRYGLAAAVGVPPCST